MNRDETPASGVMPPKPRRRRRPLLTFLLVIALLVAFHAPLLRGVGSFLVHDAPHTDKCDALLVRFDVESVRAAVELQRQGRVDRVLLMPAEPRTTDKLGITESPEAETRRELIARGVPESIIEIVPTQGFSLPQRIAAAGEYLRNHPDKRLNVVTPRLQGRYVRHVAREVSDEATLARLAFASVPPQQYDEQNWWRSRVAVVQVFQNYVQLTLAATTDLPRNLGEKIDWSAWETAIAKGEKP